MEKIICKQIKEPEVLIVVNGFSVEGKTSFVYNIKLDDIRTSIPKFDIDIENASVESFIGWGRSSERPFLAPSVINSDAVIFIADSSDADSLMEAKAEFDNYEYKDPIFVIAANNSNTEGAMPISQVQGIFMAQKLRKKHICQVFPVSTATGEGICEIMEWVWQTLKERREAQKKKERSERLFNVSFLKAPAHFIKRLFTKI